MKYLPLEDRIIVKEIKSSEPETTNAGIITDTIRKETKQGVVVSVGSGRYAIETGVFMPTALAANDIVLYGASGGLPIEIPNEEGVKEECLMFRESDILCLLKKSSENN